MSNNKAKKRRGTGPRQSQYAHGHTMYEGTGGCMTLCAGTCGQLIEAKLGHPSGQRCPECYAAYLTEIRARKQ